MKNCTLSLFTICFLLLSSSCRESHIAEENTLDLGITYNKSGLNDVATNITLSVHSNGWGTLLDTITMEKEGDITLEVQEENPYSGDKPNYFTYAASDGFFTDFHYSEFEETVTVDLEPIMLEKVNGSIFIRQNFFGPSKLKNRKIDVYSLSENRQGWFTTDSEGRFVISIIPGNYILRFTDDDESQYSEKVTLNTGYNFIEIPAKVQAAKPNIYLYPEKTLTVAVGIGFPSGGEVTESIPEYGKGWAVTVETDGTVDGKYGFLFYEASTPNRYQMRRGWIVAKKDLHYFFSTNLSDYGFRGREIEDFTEYWIPRLTDFPYYVLYPQLEDEIEKTITLTVAPKPDSIRRLFYLAKGVESSDVNLEQPVVRSFSRKGFSILEWGVVFIP